MALDGLTDAFDHLSMGESTEHSRAQARHQPRGAGRVRRRVPPARGRRGQERPVRRRDRRRPGPAARRRAAVRDRGRGHPAGHHRRDAGQAQARVRPRTARSRPAPRRRSPTAPPPWWWHVGRGGPARAAPTCWPRSARTATWPGPDNSLHSQPSNAIKQALAKAGLERHRPGPDRDQRGVRGGRHPVHARPRREPRHRERQRRRDRHRPPDRRFRAPGSRCTCANELRRRGGGLGAAGAVRRRRPGRGAAAAGPWLSLAQASG